MYVPYDNQYDDDEDDEFSEEPDELADEFSEVQNAIESRDLDALLWNLLAYSFKSHHLRPLHGSSGVVRDYVQMLKDGHVDTSDKEALKQWLSRMS